MLKSRNPSELRAMLTELERRLQEFDGVAVSILSEARSACRNDPDFHFELIRLCRDPREHIANGATWIVKAESDDGVHFEPEVLNPLISSLDTLPDWQARLHICQSVDAFVLSRKQAETFFGWAASLADHDRPFLRAWSVHAMVNLSLRFDRLLDGAEAALCAAERDTAASVRARARKLRKLFE